jgi:tripartite-type tricarboxylate transporter receptor subunit TctC
MYRCLFSRFTTARLLLRALAASITASTLLLAATSALALYPTKPVRLIVPFPAGGATDVAARELGESLSKLLGQPFVVENRPGADGAVAAHAVLEAPADGYTLFFASSSIEGVPLVQRAAQFKSLTDFTPVSLVCRLAFGVVINPTVPATTVQELVAYARANPDKLNYGSGSLSEFRVASQFMKATGTRLVKINYKGGAQVVPDLVSGQVHISFGPLTPMLPMVRDKRLTALAVLSDKRAGVVPDTPTLREAGIVGVSGAGLQVVLAPPRVPSDIVKRLAAAIKTVMADPEVQRKFIQRGQEPQTSTPGALTTLLQAERAQWNRFVKDEGLKPE